VGAHQMILPALVPAEKDRHLKPRRGGVAQWLRKSLHARRSRVRIPPGVRF
jgi:hypothetical protein